MQSTHPPRHAEAGEPCRAQSPTACEKAFPGTHHTPKHCLPVAAVTLGVPSTPRRRSVLWTSYGEARRYGYRTTEAQGLTR